MNLIIEEPMVGKGKVCEKIIRSLPEWFGIETAIIQYVKDIEQLPTFIAMEDNQTIGFLTIKKHNQFAAEIYVMGVLSQFHRNGIGSSLIEEAETFLKQNNVEYLQVKTLGESHPDKYYALTRNFYLKMGFKPIEEFSQIWQDIPCLLMIKAF
ncbi:MAG: GNAT family N-acetyltransferase [Cyanobacteria bacterium J06636_27]